MFTIYDEKKPAPRTVACPRPERGAPTIDGHIVSVTADELVVKNQAGKECSHILANEAELTRDGVLCDAADLKVGSRTRITMTKDDRNVVTRVESLDRRTEFAKYSA